jgi:hypothetical protein
VNHPVQYCQGSIAQFTNTKCRRRGTRLCYFGLAANVEIAKYLTKVFRAAMDTEWKRY